MDYLQNYLSVLPEYDRQEVEKLIQDNTDLLEVKVISKEEFEALLQKLANRKDKVTTLEPTDEKLDAEHFNNMHSNVELDLKRLYQSHLAVEKVIANYNRILKGGLDDIKREVDALETRVEELNLKAKSEDGLILKTYGFEEKNKDKHMETDKNKYAHLFLDRDGTPIESATLNRSFHQHYLSLPIEVVEDGLHRKDGSSTAKVKLIYQPDNAMSDINHPIKHCIDGSDETYWAQAVVTSRPAYSKVPKI